MVSSGSNRINPESHLAFPATSGVWRGLLAPIKTTIPLTHPLSYATDLDRRHFTAVSNHLSVHRSLLLHGTLSRVAGSYARLCGKAARNGMGADGCLLQPSAPHFLT